jgi:membrane associated rhomboid family serine protease
MNSHPLIISIIIVNFLIYALVSFAPPSFAEYLFSILILRPNTFLEVHSLKDFLFDTLALFGYGFLHLNFFHAAGNMAGLLIFGSALARTLSSSLTFLFLYLSSIGIAAINTIYQQHYSLGASGGVSGIMGALCAVTLFKPRIFRLYNPGVKGKSILSFSIFWLALNIILAVIPPQNGLIIPYTGIDLASVGWTTHIIGFFAGFVLASVLSLFPAKIFKSS